MFITDGNQLTNSIVGIIRKILKNSPFYNGASNLYHHFKLVSMRVALYRSGVKYLPPLSMGGEYKSQYGQDYYLEKLGLIGDKGFFVEVGCNDPIFNSNSHYLETVLGWSGVAIDGIDYSAQYADLRKRTIFINILIDENEGYSEFYEVRDVTGWENQVSSVYKETLKMSKGFEADIKKIKSMPLRLIKEINRPIDLCLIDVEGHEFSVLRSINWKIQKPKIFVIENNGQFYSRKMLVEFMIEKGYKHIARIGTSDDIFSII